MGKNDKYNELSIKFLVNDKKIHVIDSLVISISISDQIWELENILYMMSVTDFTREVLEKSPEDIVEEIPTKLITKIWGKDDDGEIITIIDDQKIFNRWECVQGTEFIMKKGTKYQNDIYLLNIKLIESIKKIKIERKYLECILRRLYERREILLQK